jgi:uncharacterized phiE125 gp8 family phage protein
MSLIRLSGPPELPISLAEIIEHLRLEGTEAQDALLLGYARSVTAAIDGADGWLGRALTTQQWQLRLDRFPTAVIELPLPPLQSVDAVAYVDPDGVTQTLAPFRVFGVGAGGSIMPAEGMDWPGTRAEPEAVRVTFTAGYGTFTDVPEPIRHGLLFMIGEMYDGPCDPQLTAAVRVMLLPYRAHWTV